MLDRVLHFWEKMALVVLVLLFILFEIRLTLVVPETYLVVIFSIIDFGLIWMVIKNIGNLREVK